MRLLQISLLGAFVLAVCGCATSSGIPASQTLTPESVSGGTEPITFTRLVVRVPAGTEIGGHHRGLLKIRHDTYTWGGDISVASDQFKVIASETMEEYGFSVLGGDNLLFGDDESAQATYQIGGTIQDLRYNTYGFLAGDNAEGWMKVEWQLNNALQDQVVFTDTTTGAAEHDDAGTGAASLKEAFRVALTNLLANEEFASLVRAPGDSLQTGQAAATTRRMTACRSPVATNLPQETEDAFQAAPLVRVGDSHGSGVVISPAGYLLTAAHVVSGVERARVRFRSGLELGAEVIARDPPQDIALLKLPGSGHGCLPLSDASPAPVGSDVFAIGAPASEDLSFSLSRGVVSGHREMDGYSFLQTDASLNPGNSGGPLLNRQGEVIGIVSFKIAGQLFEGLGFGVPPSAIEPRLGLQFE